mgnify:CR=1 FL=1
MKHLWFIFCKGDLMLEKLPNGSFSIPEGDQPPIATKDWTHVLNVSPMDNGNEVKTFLLRKGMIIKEGRGRYRCNSDQHH